MIIKLDGGSGFLFPGQDFPLNKLAYNKNVFLNYFDDIIGKKYKLENGKTLTIGLENDEVACIASNQDYDVENVFYQDKFSVKAGTYFLKDHHGPLVIKKNSGSNSLEIRVAVFRKIEKDQIPILIDLYKHLDNLKWQIPALSSILLGGFFSYLGVQLTSVESYPSPALMAFLSFFAGILFFILALSIRRISNGHSRLHFFIAAQSDYHYFSSHPFFNNYFKNSFSDSCLYVILSMSIIGLSFLFVLYFALSQSILLKLCLLVLFILFCFCLLKEVACCFKIKVFCLTISSIKYFEWFLYLLFVMLFSYSISLLLSDGKFVEPKSWNKTVYCTIRKSINPSPSSIGPAIVKNQLIISPQKGNVEGEYCTELLKCKSDSNGNQHDDSDCAADVSNP